MAQASAEHFSLSKLLLPVVTLTFCGAAGTTTGSQHLLEINGQRILLDCGLYQGSRKEAYARNLQFPWFDPASIDTVVLSHAHIDHAGNLPNLCKQGFTGDIHSTFATRDLSSIMLQDSARIQSSDIEYLNRKRARAGEEPLEGLYTPQDAERCLRQFVTGDYHRPRRIAEGVEIEFIDAGHILGSAQVILTLTEGNRRQRLLFSGDIGRGNNELLRDPEIAEDIDLVLMESTYGGRTHELPASALDELGRSLNEALATNGKVIVPAFAVERTQQLLYALHRLFLSGAVAPVPVFVDSPLAVSATEVFRLHPECFNDASYEHLFAKGDPFGFNGLTLIRSVEESRALNDFKGPAIIISASGMCEAGRVLHHLKHHLGHAHDTVLFVGYCAENTLGRRIRDGISPVNIFGKPYPVRARVVALDSFSGHADHHELLAWFQRITGPKTRTWLVHGEAEAAAALAPDLEKLGTQVEIGQLGREVTL